MISPLYLKTTYLPLMCLKMYTIWGKTPEHHPYHIETEIIH